MDIRILDISHFERIKTLLKKYKSSINESIINENQFDELKNAILNNRITFYTIHNDNDVIGMCSISTIFSTYKCDLVGMFDDFFIDIEYRKKGYARELVNYVFDDMKNRKINSVLVGCSEIDVKMYKKLGFDMEIGYLLSWRGI